MHLNPEPPHSSCGSVEYSSRLTILPFFAFWLKKTKPILCLSLLWIVAISVDLQGEMETNLSALPSPPFLSKFVASSVTTRLSFDTITFTALQLSFWLIRNTTFQDPASSSP